MTAYYLKIDGVAGTSPDKTHQNWFDIVDFSFGVDGASKIAPLNFGALSVTGEFDAALAALLSGTTSSKMIRAVEIEGVDISTGKIVYDLTLNDVLIGALSEGGADGTNSLESISFSYDRIGLVTSGGATPQSFGYDLVAGVSINPLSLIDATVPSSTGAVRATQFFLKIDGVAGTSTDKTHQNWFDIDGFSLGVDRAASTQFSIARPNFGELSVTGEFDAALAALLSRTTSGKVIRAVEIEGVDISTGNIVYDLTLNDVVVSALSEGGADGANSPESISFSYDRIGLVTSGGPTTQSFGYDLVTDLSINPLLLIDATVPSSTGAVHATQFFLKIDGVAGTSPDKTHQNWFDIDGFSLGVDRAASTQFSIARPNFGELSVTGEFDAALAALLSRTTSGKVIRAVEIEGVDISTGKIVYDLTLNDVLIGALSEGGENGANSLESISFSYDRIGLVTSGGATPQSFGYDLVTGLSINPLSLIDATVPSSTGAVHATQFFLKIDGVAGTSPDKTHQNWFDIVDFSFGVDGASKIAPLNFGALSVTGEFDAALAALLSGTTSSKMIRAVEIEGVDISTGKIVYDLTLNDVLIGALSEGGADGTNSLESISFSYDRIGLVTSGGATPQSFGYDLVAGVSINPLSLIDATVPSSTGAVRATQFFLKIDGVAGTSTDKTHQNWFDIDGFSLGVDRAASTQFSIARPNFGELSVTGEFDAALAALLSRTTSGKVIRAVEIEGVDISTGNIVYDLTLNDVVVSALSEGGADGANSPESISFSYDRIGLVTSGGPTTQSFGYDLVTDLSINPLLLIDAAVPSSTGAVHATQFFLKIDGVAGTSPDKTHQNWFDIVDFSFGVDGASKIAPLNFGALSVTGEFDAALAALLSNTVPGKMIGVVEIEGVDISTGKIVYDLTLNDVLIGALSEGGENGANSLESISFTYGGIGLVTSGGGTPQNFAYDIVFNSPPEIISGVIVTQTSTVVSHSLLARDIEGDPLTFSLSTPLPAGSATVSASGSYSYVAPAVAGLDAFTYSVSDGQGNVVAGRVDVTIVNGLSSLNAAGTAGRDVFRGGNLDDVLNGADGDDLLYGGAGGDSLVGGAGNDNLYGESGGDTLIGGQGSNLVTGGEGNDLYIVDNAGDLIVENANEGIDVVRSAVTYTLASNVEMLVLLGGGNLNAAGSNDNNILSGNSGNNVLDGAAGADVIAGGPGNDVYGLDDSGDQVMELGNSGFDQVMSGVSYDLMQAWHVENLTLTGNGAINGSGNWLDNMIFGNAAANMLNGNQGNDTLDGGAGIDMLSGGVGDDVLAYDATDGGIDGGAGTDTLRIEGGGMSIDLGALGGAVVRDVEIIDITGSGNNILILSLADVLAISSTTNMLHVIGNAGDVVHAGGNWIAESYLGSGPLTYNQGLAILLIEPGVGFNVL